MSRADELMNMVEEQIGAGNVAMEQAYRAIVLQVLQQRGTHEEILAILHQTEEPLEDHMNDADCIAVASQCQKILEKITVLEDALGERVTAELLPGMMQRTLKHMEATDQAPGRGR